MATMKIGRAMVWADILNALGGAGRVRDSNNESESESLNRQSMSSLKKGCGQARALCRHRRRLASQHRVGVVAAR